MRIASCLQKTTSMQMKWIVQVGPWMVCATFLLARSAASMLVAHYAASHIHGDYPTDAIMRL